MEPFNPQQPPLLINDQSRIFLQETARWGKFLAIVGFVILGLGVAAAIFGGIMMATQLPPFTQRMSISMLLVPTISTVLYGLLFALYFFPCLNLYRFANKTKAALLINDEEILTQAFSNLKSLFKFVGVLTIIVLGLYVLSVFIGVMMLAVFQR